MVQPTGVEVSKGAERNQARGEPDPFPPEGTDERIIKPGAGDKPLSEQDRIRATRAVIHTGRYLPTTDK